MSYEKYRRCGAIICKHVSDGHHPILFASRGTPLQLEDSGWQFLCSMSGHQVSDAALWLLEEVANLDPSLMPILDAEIGSSFNRPGIEGTAWVGDGPRAMDPYHFAVSVPQKMLHDWRGTPLIARFALDEAKRTLQMEIAKEKPEG